MVSMARPLLADPQWPNKARAGTRARDQHLHRVQPGVPGPRVREQARELPGESACVRGNRTRVRRAQARAASPWSARARRAWPARRKPPRAAIASRCSTCASEIGGQFNLAKRIPGKEEFHETLRYFRHRIAETGVALHLGARVDADALQGFDAVVLATGVVPRAVSFRRRGRIAKVVSYLDVLEGRVVCGPRVAIVGAGGIGFDVAEFLVHEGPSPRWTRKRWMAEWGIDPSFQSRGGLDAPRPEAPARAVWLLQRTEGRPGARLGKTTGWIHRATLKAKGVRMLGGVEYLGVDDAGSASVSAARNNTSASTTSSSAPARNRAATCSNRLQAAGRDVHVIGGADVATELDAKRAIDQGTRLAAKL
jgi:2,4-dienoyl-CoA reductase (NADPH2)